MGAAPLTFIQPAPEEDRAAMSIARWLSTGERGLSSEAIALAALGECPAGLRASWPHDPADLRRGLLLLEQCPEAAELGLPVLAARCPKWAALVKVWDRLAETLRSEIGDGLPAGGSDPKTYAMMREALDSVRQTARTRRSEPHAPDGTTSVHVGGVVPSLPHP